MDVGRVDAAVGGSTGQDAVPRHRLVGRGQEREWLRDRVRGAADGSPCLLLLHGEAGVGKTSLVRDLVGELEDAGTQVLWGSGLRFGAADALLLPVVMALDGWLRKAAPVNRDRVLGGLSGAEALLPNTVDGGDKRVSARPVAVAGALINRIAEIGPVLLVVDDVQWADPASRDVLSYLVAGFTRQRLVLVATHRDEESRRSEDFQTWLADMRRMPSVSDLHIDRLPHEATRAQLSALLGAVPTPRLVDLVFARSQGNAYMTELLVSELDASTEALPEGLPAALSEALLAAWRRLSPPAREVTRYLAVAGQPTQWETLRAVITDLTGQETLTPALHEAINAGIAVVGSTGVWFRHPLLAEVLADTYLPGEAAPVHAAWASALAGGTADGIDELRRQSALALHYQAANDPANAFTASVQAANLAQHGRAHREAARHLVRAATLWTAGASDPGDIDAMLDLLERATRMCLRTDRAADAHAFVTRALDAVDEQADPLRASRLLMNWADLEWQLGRLEKPPTEDLMRAAELARSVPDSREYAQATAMVTTSLRWSSRLAEAAAAAEEAVMAARRSGSPRAISQALGARAQTRSDPVLAHAECLESVEWARKSGDDLTLTYAYGALANLLAGRGEFTEFLTVIREMRDHAIEHGRGGAESAFLGEGLLLLGDLAGAAEVLQEGLGLSGNTEATVRLRLSAAIAAVRQGDSRLARMHEERAQELIASLRRPVGAPGEIALVELRLAESQPDAALELIGNAMREADADAADLDTALVWGARAAADLVETGHDQRNAETIDRGRRALSDLVALRADLSSVPFTPGGEMDQITPALGALFEAERRRATGAADARSAWRDAAAACDRAGMRWHQHWALCRLAAASIENRDTNREAADALRQAHRYAQAQGALPLTRAVQQIAASGRVSLSDPAVVRKGSSRPAALAQLTEREAEVLAYLVAHRTNAEIAAALFISEKTVSVHVSNLLRKTSTGSRHEVAALAIRLGIAESDDAHA